MAVAVVAFLLPAVACREVAPRRLRVGMIAPLGPELEMPSPQQLRARYAPFVAYLGRTLHVPTELEATRDLPRLSADFEAGRFDIAFLGAVDFAHAHERTGAVPLVTRESDRHYTAVFLAAAGDPRGTLDDFKGATIAFGPRFSTSHVMARHFLGNHGIVPERYFREVSHSGSADETAVVVAERRFDLAVTGMAALTQLFQAGRLRPDQVKIVWETPPYVTSAWTASAALSPGFRGRVRDAFLALTPADPEQAAVLESMNATAFLPVSLDDYASLITLMRQMQLIDVGRAGE